MTDRIFKQLAGGIKFTKPKEAKEVAQPDEKKIKFYLTNEDGENTEPQEALIDSFDDMGLHDWLRSNIEEHCNWKNPTQVQQVAIPLMLKQNDAIVVSPTGSGKTGAFMIPVLQDLTKGKTAVIVVPTKELATQIYHQGVKLLGEDAAFELVLLNKVSIGAKNKDTEKSEAVEAINFDILITTPQKLTVCLKKKLINLQKQAITTSLLDRLLSEDYGRDLEYIIENSKYDHLSIFTATLYPQIEDLAKAIQKDPVKVVIGTSNTAVSNVDQKLLYSGSEEGKIMGLKELILKGLMTPAIIFLQSKERAKQLYKLLKLEDYDIGVITGDQPNEIRDKTVNDFRTGELSFLICTDLMSRGLDFKAVSTVINYDVPPSTTTYIHRIGRTGRMGKQGSAYTFYTDADADHMKPIVNLMLNSGQRENVPEWMLLLNNKKLKVVKRVRVGGISASPEALAEHAKKLKKAERERQLAEKRRAKKRKRDAADEEDDEPKSGKSNKPRNKKPKLRE